MGRKESNQTNKLSNFMENSIGLKRVKWMDKTLLTILRWHFLFI